MSEAGRTTPATVMLVRHGEKPGDPEDDDKGGRDLSLRGSARAVALPALFVPASSELACGLRSSPGGAPGFLGEYAVSAEAGGPARFPTPQAVFATADSDASHRPKQTIRPTAEALGLPVDDGYSNSEGDIGRLAALMWTAPYAGRTVLICWHHGKMAALAAALGVPDMAKWPGGVFDMLWRIDYSGTGQAALTTCWQRLLYGDQEGA